MVSVVIPTHQRRDCVRRAVASVLAQRYQNFELIIVDDGSTDGTDLALRNRDPRVRYRWQEHRGVAAARNTALALARGEIVAFLDSDNRWLPDHLTVVTAAFVRFPNVVLVSTCPGFLIRGREPVARATIVDALPSLLLLNRVGYTSCTGVRSWALREAGGFDERLAVYEDSDLWARLAMLGPFCLLSHRTIVHRASREGLKQRGVAAGEYVKAMVLSARGAQERLRDLGRADLDELEARLQAKLLVVDAIQALSLGDHEGAGRRLSAACSLAPELSCDPEIILGVMRLLPIQPDAAPRLVATTAALWPDRRAQTPRYLEGYGVIRALQARQLMAAAQQAGRAYSWLDPSFLMRTAPLSIRLFQRWLHLRTARGMETD
jgi:GT2 family glycosyltransferase